MKECLVPPELQGIASPDWSLRYSVSPAKRACVRCGVPSDSAIAFYLPSGQPIYDFPCKNIRCSLGCFNTGGHDFSLLRLIVRSPCKKCGHLSY